MICSENCLETLVEACSVAFSPVLALRLRDQGPRGSLAKVDRLGQQMGWGLVLSAHFGPRLE